MDEIKIASVNHYQGDDFDELNIHLDNQTANPTFADPVDEQHNFFLRVDAVTDEVVGAMILYANDWFEEIAAAFQRHDLENPAVRFFLKEKLEEFIRERDEQADAPAVTNLTP